MSIGDAVKRVLLDADMTQEELAKRSGLSTGHVSDIVNGLVKNLQISTIHKLALGLNVEPSYLIDRGRE